MIHRRWQHLVFALLAAATAVALPVSDGVAQEGYAGGLPPGVEEAGISDGSGTRSLSADGTAVVQTRQPVVSGKLDQSGGTVLIGVDGTGLEFTAPVAADGSFEAKVPESLEPGRHTLFFNNKLIGEFIVQAADPLPPDTGTGSTVFDDAGRLYLPIGLAIVVLAGGILLTARRARR